MGMGKQRFSLLFRWFPPANRLDRDSMDSMGEPSEGLDVTLEANLER